MNRRVLGAQTRSGRRLASTIDDSNPMQRSARDARVATIHGAGNDETAAEDYGRLLAGQPMFNPFG